MYDFSQNLIWIILFYFWSSYAYSNKEIMYMPIIIDGDFLLFELFATFRDAFLKSEPELHSLKTPMTLLYKFA